MADVRQRKAAASVSPFNADMIQPFFLRRASLGVATGFATTRCGWHRRRDWTPWCRSEAEAGPVGARYEIRVRGQISERMRRALDDYPVRADGVDTALSVDFEDTAKLKAFLERLDELGLDVIELRRMRESSE